MKITGLLAAGLLATAVLTQGCGKASDDMSVPADHSLVRAGSLIVGNMPMKADGTGYFELSTVLANDTRLMSIEKHIGGTSRIDYSTYTNTTTSSSSSSSLASSLSASDVTSALGGSKSAVASSSPIHGGVGSQSFGNGSLAVRAQLSGSGVATGPATGGATDLAGAICDLFEGLFLYIDRCYSTGLSLDFTTIFGSDCRTYMSQALAGVATASIDPRGIAALSCTGHQLASSVGCVSATDISSPMFTALNNCGVFVSQSSTSASH